MIAKSLVNFEEICSCFGLSKREFTDLLELTKKHFINTNDDEIVSTYMEILDMLSEIFKPETIKLWFDKANPVLNDKSPRDFLQETGDVFMLLEEAQIMNKFLG